MRESEGGGSAFGRALQVYLEKNRGWMNYRGFSCHIFLYIPFFSVFSPPFLYFRHYIRTYHTRLRFLCGIRSNSGHFISSSFWHSYYLLVASQQYANGVVKARTNSVFVVACFFFSCYASQGSTESPRAPKRLLEELPNAKEIGVPYGIYGIPGWADRGSESRMPATLFWWRKDTNTKFSRIIIGEGGGFCAVRSDRRSHAGSRIILW